MTDRILKKEISKSTGIPYPIVDEVISNFCKTLKDTTKVGERIVVKGLGVFEPKEGDKVKINFSQSRSFNEKKDYSKMIDQL